MLQHFHVSFSRDCSLLYFPFQYFNACFRKQFFYIITDNQVIFQDFLSNESSRDLFRLCELWNKMKINLSIKSFRQEFIYCIPSDYVSVREILRHSKETAFLDESLCIFFHFIQTDVCCGNVICNAIFMHFCKSNRHAV